MKEMVPRAVMDTQLNGLAKRFADVEWNILRPNPEVREQRARGQA
jgi:hypothetical protein